MCSNWNIGVESVEWKITIIEAVESRCKLGNRKWKCVCVLEKEPMTTPTTKITCRLIIIITVLPHTTAICYNKTKISIYKHFRSNAVNSDREHTRHCVCVHTKRAQIICANILYVVLYWSHLFVYLFDTFAQTHAHIN